LCANYFENYRVFRAFADAAEIPQERGMSSQVVLLYRFERKRYWRQVSRCDLNTSVAARQRVGGPEPVGAGGIDGSPGLILEIGAICSRVCRAGRSEHAHADQCGANYECPESTLHDHLP